MSSPAAAAAAAAAGLLPPGLEALYRQAGFPTAFLGLGAGGVPPAGAGGTAPGGGVNPGSSNATPLSVSNSSSTTTTSPYAHVGLQSHANNPNCKYIHFMKLLRILICTIMYIMYAGRGTKTVPSLIYRETVPLPRPVFKLNI